MSGGHGHIDTSNKRIALLVAILAALLAVSEMGGKSSQTNALASHIDASNLWSFFQSKTIRQTTLRTAAEEVEATYKDGPTPMPPALKAQAERLAREQPEQPGREADPIAFPLTISGTINDSVSSFQFDGVFEP